MVSGEGQYEVPSTSLLPIKNYYAFRNRHFERIPCRAVSGMRDK